MLTQPEMQRMLSIVKSNITDLEVDLKDAKESAKILFKRCSPEDPTSHPAFIILNNEKDFIRRCRSEIKKLAALSKSLKKGTRKPHNGNMVKRMSLQPSPNYCT